ncbi:MAG: DUF72 domain-containing protein [Polyangiaceae bacterium]|nr:DUF72 domain-containing protein [Polyangiaceae bacterium]
MAPVYEEAARLAARLPKGLRMGTSSWTFPGWAGLVYAEHRPVQELAKDGRREYARHPLLTTVGIDRSFYAPVPDADYARYASQLPPGFPCVSKAPQAIVAQVLTRGPEGGASIHVGAGRGPHPGLRADEPRYAPGPAEPNPDFFSADRFIAWHARPLLSAFRGHAGPVLLELPPAGPAHRLPPRDFFVRLDAFLADLPRELRYAVELRERAYFTPEYAEILRAHGVAHAYTYWRAMPTPGAQARVVPVTNAPFALVRLSLKPGRRYEQEKARFDPFNRIVEPDPAMRGEVARILREAAEASMESFLLVNNKAEGSAPLTVQAIAEQVIARAPP